MTNKIKTKICLNDEEFFNSLNGLWKGKKPPFTNAIVIRNTNFSIDGRIDLSNVAVLEVETKQLEKRKLYKGDIIVERSGGGPKQPVGRVVYFDVDDKTNDYSFSNFTSVIRVKNKNRFYDKYVFYYLYNFYLQGHTDHLQRRTTGIRNLDFEGYKSSIIFPGLSIEKQKSIARQLTITQNAIAKQEDLIDKLAELKRNMMHYLFTHGTKGEKTKMTEIGEIPESWEVVELGKVVDITSGGTPSRKKEKYWAHGTIPWVKTGEINFNDIYDTEEKINEEGLINSAAKLFPAGTLLMAMYGQGVTRARVAILKINASTNQACAVLLTDQLTSLYLFFYLSFIHEKIRLIGHGANQKNLNTNLIGSIKIPICNDDEKNKIIRKLKLCDHKIELQQKKLSIYQNLFKTLLHELMNGEKD